MNVEERAHLIERHLEEIITHDDLIALLESGEPIKHYIGFEISGQLHLGTGVVCMSKVKDLMDAGVDCNILLADWHTWINDKLGGDRETIQRTAVGYFKEGLKASLAAVGGNPDKINFVLGTDLYSNQGGYWETLIDVSKNVTLSRIERSISIMGRESGEGIDFAKLIYPPMQVADIFFQGINIAQGGLDQRKAHVVARDVANSLTITPLRNAKGEQIKPIAIHTHLILGLNKPPVWPVDEDNVRDIWTSMKMSKSRPNSAIFIHDSPNEIREKIKGAFCPPDSVIFNPIIDWIEYLVFREEGATLEIKRPEKWGGNVTFHNIDEVKEMYASGEMHPLDLKNALADYLIDLLEPVRARFAEPEVKALWDDLLSLS
jgi:tyrosyl-tRNA synthetase